MTNKPSKFSKKKKQKTKISLSSDSVSIESKKRAKFTVTLTNIKYQTITLVSPNFTRNRKLERYHSYDQFCVPTPSEAYETIEKNLEQKQTRNSSANGKMFGRTCRKLVKVNNFVPKDSYMHEPYFLDVYDKVIHKNKNVGECFETLFGKMLFGEMCEYQKVPIPTKKDLELPILLDILDNSTAEIPIPQDTQITATVKLVIPVVGQKNIQTPRKIKINKSKYKKELDDTDSKRTKSKNSKNSKKRKKRKKSKKGKKGKKGKKSDKSEGIGSCRSIMTIKTKMSKKSKKSTKSKMSKKSRSKSQSNNKSKSKSKSISKNRIINKNYKQEKKKTSPKLFSSLKFIQNPKQTKGLTFHKKKEIKMISEEKKNLLKLKCDTFRNPYPKIPTSTDLDLDPVNYDIELLNPQKNLENNKTDYYNKLATALIEHASNIKNQKLIEKRQVAAEKRKKFDAQRESYRQTQFNSKNRLQGSRRLGGLGTKRNSDSKSNKNSKRPSKIEIETPNIENNENDPVEIISNVETDSEPNSQASSSSSLQTTSKKIFRSYEEYLQMKLLKKKKKKESKRRIDTLREASNSSEELSKESQPDFENFQKLKFIRSQRIQKILGYSKKNQVFQIKEHLNKFENRLKKGVDDTIDLEGYTRKGVDDALDLEGYTKIENLKKVTDRKIARVEQKNRDKLNMVKELAMEKINTYQKYDAIPRFRLPLMTQGPMKLIKPNLTRIENVRRSVTPSGPTGLSKISKLVHAKFNETAGEGMFCRKDTNYVLNASLNATKNSGFSFKSGSKSQGANETIKPTPKKMYSRLSLLSHESLSVKHQKCDTNDKRYQGMGLKVTPKKNEQKKLMFTTFNLDSAMSYGKQGILDMEIEKNSRNFCFMNPETSTKNTERVTKIDLNEIHQDSLVEVNEERVLNNLFLKKARKDQNKDKRTNDVTGNDIVPKIGKRFWGKEVGGLVENKTHGGVMNFPSSDDKNLQQQRSGKIMNKTWGGTSIERQQNFPREENFLLGNYVTNLFI